MKKRIKQAVSLAVAVFVCLLSIPLNFANAAEIQMLYVNNVDMLDVQAEKPNGVTYDPATSTLTLNNATLDVSRVNGDITNVIYAIGDLKIKIVGDNTVFNNNNNGMPYGIEVRGNLTIESDAEATLSVTAQDRSFHIEGNFVIGDGTNATTINTSGEIHAENPGNMNVNANSTLANSSGGLSCNSIDGQGIFPKISGPGEPGPGPGGHCEPFKLSINGEVLIDETADEPIRYASGEGFEIKELGFMPGYTIDVDTSVISEIGYIETQGDTQLILSPDGDLTVKANGSGYSFSATGMTEFF